MDADEPERLQLALQLFHGSVDGERVFPAAHVHELELAAALEIYYLVRAHVDYAALGLHGDRMPLARGHGEQVAGYDIRHVAQKPGLAHEPEGAHLERLEHAILAVGNVYYVRLVVARAQFLAEGYAVHAGHVDVQEQQVEHEVVHAPQQSGRRHERLHVRRHVALAERRLDRAAYHLRDVLLVVTYRDFYVFHVCHPPCVPSDPPALPPRARSA